MAPRHLQRSELDVKLPDTESMQFYDAYCRKTRLKPSNTGLVGTSRMLTCSIFIISLEEYGMANADYCYKKFTYVTHMWCYRCSANFENISKILH